MTASVTILAVASYPWLVGFIPFLAVRREPGIRTRRRGSGSKTRLHHT